MSPKTGYPVYGIGTAHITSLICRVITIRTLLAINKMLFTDMTLLANLLNKQINLLRDLTRPVGLNLN